MEAIAAAVAVLGTLLGALVQRRFQRQSAIETNELARLESLRQERLAASAEYAEALAKYRCAQIDRWYARDQAGSTPPENEHEVHRQRDLTQGALFRLQLVSDSEELASLADSVFLAMNAFKAASSRDEVEMVRDSTHAMIREFVRAAGRQLEPGSTRRAHEGQSRSSST